MGSEREGGREREGEREREREKGQNCKTQNTALYLQELLPPRSLRQLDKPTSSSSSSSSCPNTNLQSTHTSAPVKARPLERVTHDISIVQRFGHIALGKFEDNGLFLIHLGLQQRRHLVCVCTHKYLHTTNMIYIHRHLLDSRGMEAGFILIQYLDL